MRKSEEKSEEKLIEMKRKVFNLIRENPAVTYAFTSPRCRFRRDCCSTMVSTDALCNCNLLIILMLRHGSVPVAPFEPLTKNRWLWQSLVNQIDVKSCCSATYGCLLQEAT